MNCDEIALSTFTKYFSHHFNTYWQLQLIFQNYLTCTYSVA